MKQSKINEILAAHKKWLDGEPNGKKADLTDAGFTGANLRDTDFTGANLTDADFTGANLRDTDFTGANLSGADFTGADLRDTDFTGADLDYSCLPLWCGSLSAKFDKKHYIQFLYHTLKSLEANGLVDDELKKSLLTPENVAIANRFHRVDECGEITAWKEQGGQPHAT